VQFKGYFLQVPDTPGLGADVDDSFLQGCESITV
jgi:hypothetical protein